MMSTTPLTTYCENDCTPHASLMRELATDLAESTPAMIVVDNFWRGRLADTKPVRATMHHNTAEGRP
jgi:hypothetical protein